MTDKPEVEEARERPVSTAELAHAGDRPPERDARQRDDSTDQLVRPRRDQGGGSPLFPERDRNDLRSRWDAIQGNFVDEPRRAVEEADALVAGAMKQLAEIFAGERAELEHQWDRGDDVSTEDLRLALQRYRSFFTRLLAV